MLDHTAQAEQHLKNASNLIDASRGSDTAIPLHLASAYAHAMLALGDELRALGERIAEGLGLQPRPVEPREEPDLGLKVMPFGSAGLCMAAYARGPGSAHEFCHFPHMHGGPHSWETTLGRTD